jgi:hypothetical protein
VGIIEKSGWPLLFALLVLASSARGTVIAYWRFEQGPADASSSNIFDSSGNGLTGFSVSGPPYRTDVPTSFIPGTGAADHFSLQFNGTSQRVFVPTTPISP